MRITRLIPIIILVITTLTLVITIAVSATDQSTSSDTIRGSASGNKNYVAPTNESLISPTRVPVPDCKECIIDLGGVPRIDTNLSYGEGKRLADSVAGLQHLVKNFNDMPGSSFTFGMGDVSIKASHRKFARSAPEVEKQQLLYYVGFGGYDLNENDHKFYRLHDTYNLVYTAEQLVAEKKSSSNKIVNDGYKTYSKYYATKPIRVAYSSTGKTIYLPVSYAQYRTVEAVLYLAAFAFCVAALYFFLSLPFALIRDIARGQAFTPENIARLNWIAAGSFILGLLFVLTPYLFRWLLASEIPNEFTFLPLSARIAECASPFIIATVAVFTAQAFRRGYVLENEQTLTI